MQFNIGYKLMKYIIFIFILLPITGCDICKHIRYNYEAKVVSASNPLIRVHAEPKNFNIISEKPYVTETKQPYLVYIEVVTDQKPGEYIQIKIQNISPTATRPNTLYSHFNSEKRGWLKTTEAWFMATSKRSVGVMAYISNENSNHQPLTIVFSVEYKGELRHFDVTLKPDYKEEKWIQAIHKLNNI